MKKNVFALMILMSFNLIGQKVKLSIKNVDLKLEEGMLAREKCSFSCDKIKEEFINVNRGFTVKIPCYSDVYESGTEKSYFAVFSSEAEAGEVIVTITELTNSEYDLRQQFLNDYFLQAEKNSGFLESGAEKINERSIS